MSKLLTTTPKQDGFYMPIESTQHRSTWMLLPHMKDNGSIHYFEVFNKIK
ncbi:MULTISPECIES: hypothetical protein [unclassified Spiroplasma]